MALLEGQVRQLASADLVNKSNSVANGGQEGLESSVPASITPLRIKLTTLESSIYIWHQLAAGAAGLGMPPITPNFKKDDSPDPPPGVKPDRLTRRPPEDYRPGKDDEFDYMFQETLQRWVSFYGKRC